MSTTGEIPEGKEVQSAKLANELQDLLKQAEAARQLAYAPFSKFNVGAALMAEDGKVFTGCNVECSSYGGTICAERTAVVKAISSGVKKFKCLVIIAVQDFVLPCGICRQFLIEFGDMPVYCAKSDKSSVQKYMLTTLLPKHFVLQGK